jgi:hypothetical protein
MKLYNKWFELKQHHKLALAVLIAGWSTVAVAQFCPPQYQEEFVQPMFQSATEALNQEISAVDESLSAELEEYSQRINSAVAILTKQKAVAANQIADTNRTAAQQTATALNTMSQEERVKQARFTFGGEFGQGYQPCAVYAGRTLIANRDADMGEETRNRMMSEVAAAPGRYIDPSQVRTSMLQEHRSLFCTADEVNSGMCDSVGAMPGASVNVATLFTPVMEADALYKAKVAFVNNVSGLPDAPVPAAVANSPAATAYALAKAQKDALASPAINSFKAAQLDYTGITTTHGGSDIPGAVRMEREVQRYLGNTPEYETWTKAMAAQNSRGLLVEMLKIKALDLKQQEGQYRQYERMEANLAVLVAGQMRSQSERVNNAAAQATAARVQSQIH